MITLRRDFDYDTLEDFEEEFGNNIFPGLNEESFQPAHSSSTIEKMFSNKIADTLSEKYSVYSSDEKMIFKQLFNFTYKDDAKMYTFGGVFILAKELESFGDYNFNNLDFINKASTPYDITFPIITNKEYHELNSLLPESDKKSFIENDTIGFIPKEHLESYYNIYKYYPAYIEIMDM